MVQNLPQQEMLPFNYADTASAGEFLPCLKLEEGKQVLVSFLEHIPGMQSPPFVFCRVHWNTEMGENGRRFQCFGGQCCEQITWQKGWGQQPGQFAKNKASKRYFIPVVHYEQDPTNPTAVRATVKYIDMTWTAFSSLSSVIEQTNEGLPFFQRDILIDVQKSSGPTNYVFNKRESQAQWMQNPILKQQVEDQLPEVGQKLLNSLPQVISESEFMQMKPALDAKVQAAMQSHDAQQNQSMPQQNFGQLPQQNFGQLPQQNFGQMPQQNFGAIQTTGVDGLPQPFAHQQYIQPQVNMPSNLTLQQTQPVEQSVNVTETQFNNIPTLNNTQNIQQAQPTQSVDIPSVDLGFDPNELLK